MSRRRWIADQFTDDRASLLGANAAHLGRVLRACVGQEFDIVCGEQLRRGTIIFINGDSVEFALGEVLESTGERELALLMAIYKFDRLEWAIEKCTELGVTRIVPVIARRTDAHLATAATKRAERWRRIAHESTQQARRLAPPQIDDPMKLKAALELYSAAQELETQNSKGQAPALHPSARLLLNENERAKNFRDALAGAAGPVVLAVGPEGGWAGEELAQFEAAGWLSVTLGPTVLRAETAAIAALAAVRAILD